MRGSKTTRRVRLEFQSVSLCALVLGLWFASTAVAHDFWVQPKEYWVTPQALTPMTLLVGHGPYRQRSPIRPGRIIRFEAIAPDGRTTDLHDNLHLGSDKEDGNFRL